MGNSSFVGAFLAGVIPLSLVLVLKAKKIHKKIIYNVLLVGLIIGLIVVHSRAAWVGCAGAMLIMFIFLPNKKRYLSYLVLTSIIIGLASSAPARDRAKSMFDMSFHTNQQRVEIWKGTLGMIKERPLLGVGIGNFNLYYPVYQTKKSLSFGHLHFVRQAHSFFVQLISEVGVLGLAAFLWIFGVLTMRYRKDNILALGLMGGIIGALITANFNFNLQIESSALYLWSMMGFYTVSLNEIS